MSRKVSGFVVGAVVYLVVGLLGLFLLRISWHQYAIAEPEFAFTLPMKILRLLLGVFCAIGTGCATAIVVGRRSLVPWILSAVLVLTFIPIHIQLWDKYPVWYHLFFLTTIIPLVGFSAKVMPQSTDRGAL